MPIFSSLSSESSSLSSKFSSLSSKFLVLSFISNSLFAFIIASLQRTPLRNIEQNLYFFTSIDADGVVSTDLSVGIVLNAVVVIVRVEMVAVVVISWVDGLVVIGVVESISVVWILVVTEIIIVVVSVVDEVGAEIVVVVVDGTEAVVSLIEVVIKDFVVIVVVVVSNEIMGCVVVDALLVAVSVIELVVATGKETVVWLKVEVVLETDVLVFENKLNRLFNELLRPKNFSRNLILVEFCWWLTAVDCEVKTSFVVVSTVIARVLLAKVVEFESEN